MYKCAGERVDEGTDGQSLTILREDSSDKLRGFQVRWELPDTMLILLHYDINKDSFPGDRFWNIIICGFCIF